MTPQEMRDKTLMTYGLNAGVPNAMVRYLRGNRVSSGP
jgi:hypothetical protein